MMRDYKAEYRRKQELYPDLNKIQYRRSLELCGLDLNKKIYQYCLENYPDYNKMHYQRKLELHGIESLRQYNREWVNKNRDRRNQLIRNFRLRQKIFNTFKKEKRNAK